MLGLIRRAISILRRKQILHKLGVAISVTVIAGAFYVLFHILRDIDVEEVMEAIKRTEWRSIALAGLFVAAGYFTLTFYDLFAVRTIGVTHVPYRVTAFAAFTSYSVGHNVGASVFTGGAVRYRIYSAWGCECGRCRKSLLSGGSHLLARQCRRARTWYRLPPRCGDEH